VEAPGGSRIRLEATRLPSGWKTTEEAIEAFLTALTGAALGGTDSPEPTESQPTKTRRRELARVDAELDRIGV
jgi:hypothetical protein